MTALGFRHGGPFMSFRHAISDADWDRLRHLLPGQPGQHGRVADDNRRFLDAVLWIARTGAPWRDLPDRLGRWNSQWRRFDRWAKAGRFAALTAIFRDPDLDTLLLDATIVRAHPSAAGSKKSGMGPGARRIRPSAAVAAGSAPSCMAGSTASANRSS
jgi:transposase